MRSLGPPLPHLCLTDPLCLCHQLEFEDVRHGLVPGTENTSLARPADFTPRDSFALCIVQEEVIDMHLAQVGGGAFQL